jgi:hypothetical protein
MAIYEGYVLANPSASSKTRIYNRTVQRTMLLNTLLIFAQYTKQETDGEERNGHQYDGCYELQDPSS